MAKEERSVSPTIRAIILLRDGRSHFDDTIGAIRRANEGVGKHD